jgi:hypothetical protein
MIMDDFTLTTIFLAVFGFMSVKLGVLMQVKTCQKNIERRLEKLELKEGV